MDRDKLNGILAEHKLWIDSHGREGKRADLSGKDLSFMNLSGVDLSGADLESVNLCGADLIGADLECINLHGANLSGADLESVNLSSAILRGAKLCGATLNFADLNHVDLREADLRHAKLHVTDLLGANLSRANLLGANLDRSAIPLSCGGLDIHIDDRQATQMLYHLVRNVRASKNTSPEMKRLFEVPDIIEAANKFHMVEECGKLEGCE